MEIPKLAEVSGGYHEIQPGEKMKTVLLRHKPLRGYRLTVPAGNPIAKGWQEAKAVHYVRRGCGRKPKQGRVAMSVIVGVVCLAIGGMFGLMIGTF